MASNYASVKLTSDFIDEARRDAELLHRSLGAQVEYWARLGRAIEQSPGFSIHRVRATLSGRMKLEDLPADEQDAVFDGLAAEFENPPAALRAHYAALGSVDGAVGADKHGRLVRRGSTGRVRRVA